MIGPMRWQHYAEFVFIALVFLSAIIAISWAGAAVVKAYRVAKPLRENAGLDKIVDRTGLSDEERARIEKHWQEVRGRVKAYGEDLGRMALPLRRCI
jgi:hypothetical protein